MLESAGQFAPHSDHRLRTNVCLNLLAEVTGALPLVLIAILLVVVYGGDRLANRDPPTPQDAGLPPETESDSIR